jgi:hypothetical protein
MHSSILDSVGTHPTAAVELMSDRVTALDDLIQSLLQDDLSDPDISIKYGKGPGVQELKAEPRTAPPDTGTSLLSEESPF